MSFREKSAWACLVTTIGVFVPYFIYVFRMLARGQLNPGSMIGLFVAAVVYQTVLIVALHIVFAVQSRQEQKDERDLAIESRSFRGAYYVLAVSSFLAIMCFFAFALAPAHTLAGQPSVFAFISELLLLCFVVAEAMKYLTQVVCYRRGI